MTTTYDITLLGGGIIGLLTARELNKAGVCVTLIDKNDMGTESSWAGGGILLPLYPWRQSSAITDLVIESLSLYPALASELVSESGISPELNPCGLLITQNPDITSAINWCNRHRVAFKDTHVSIPEGLASQPEHPLWLPDIANIRNPRLIKSLKNDLLQRGVKLLDHCEITEIHHNNNRITSIDTSRGIFAVNQLVLTTGAWTPGLLKRLFPTLRQPAPEISPVKGQMLLFKAMPDTLPSIVLEGDQYLIPRLDGHILAGSTVEDNTFDKTTTAEAKSEISEFAYKLLPALKKYPLVNHWAGIRPGSPNGIPYIDKHPEIQNLFINAGHFRNGLAMAPASAQLMADLILDRPTSVDPEPYRLDRLG
jgi:glycine oxidase